MVVRQAEGHVVMVERILNIDKHTQNVCLPIIFDSLRFKFLKLIPLMDISSQNY